MRMLLLGGNGFIGRQVAACLALRGHAVAAPPRAALDLDGAEAGWDAWLDGVDAVINTVGILREGRRGEMERLHHLAPLQLARRARLAGARHWVQLSALGADPAADTLFLASKGRGDAALLAGGLPASVARPSLVFGRDGASSCLLLRLARLPCWPLPDGGGQLVQPARVDEVAEGLVRLAEGPAAGVVDFAGAEALSLADYLRQLRRLQGIHAAARVLALPPALADCLAAGADWLPGSLFGRDSLKMLRRGSVASPAGLAGLLGRMPLASAQFGDET